MLAFDQSGMPFIILKDEEKKKRVIGTDAVLSSIASATTVLELIKTSLGPKGMDKIIVTKHGEVIITNDGATIMKEMELKNPITKLLVELSKGQDEEAGDGTTSVVVLSGLLLQNAKSLIEKGIHTRVISEGYEKACEIAINHLNKIHQNIEYLKDGKFNEEAREILKKVAMTCLSSKVINKNKEMIAELCIEAILKVADLERKDVRFDLIKVEGKVCGSVGDTELVDGVVIDKSFSHPQMEKEIRDAKVAILTCPFETPKLKTSNKIDIKTVDQYFELFNYEQDYYRKIVQKVKQSGANFVFCQWGFEDETYHLLKKNGISSIRWVSGQDIELLALATKAKIVSRFENLDSSKLGFSKLIKEVSYGTMKDVMTIVHGVETGKTVTILVRGGNNMIVEEAKRSINDALCVIRNIIHNNKVIYGGGSCEISCYLEILRSVASGSEFAKFPIIAFANSLIQIPILLADNCGHNGLMLIPEIVKLHMQDKNNYFYGVNANSTIDFNMKNNNVIDTLTVKTHQFSLATQIVRMILKINDVIVKE